MKKRCFQGRKELINGQEPPPSEIQTLGVFLGTEWGLHVMGTLQGGCQWSCGEREEQENRKNPRAGAWLLPSAAAQAPTTLMAMPELGLHHGQPRSHMEKAIIE